MKQLLSLFLFLLPCLAWAQYPSNGNQKITLGEQTTADGLIYRGVAATDTLVRKPSIDTMAYMVLDTTTNIMWHYKKATSNAWLRLNLLPSDTASMLTNYYRSGRTGIIQASDVPTLNQNTTGSAATLTTSRTFQTNLASTSTASFNGSANVTPGVTGTLPVANGGTGSATQNFVDLTTNQTVGGLKTFSNIFTSTATVNAVFAATELGTAARYLNIRNTSGGFLAGTEGSAGGFLIAGLPAYYGTIVSRAGLGISANDGTTNHMTILSGGNVGIGTANPPTKLSIFQASGSAVTADISLSGAVSAVNAGHSIDFKDNNNANSYARIAGVTNSTGTTGELSLWTSTGLSTAATEKVRIDGNGNVGIGTTSPTAGFNLQVTGANSRIFLLNSSSGSTSNYSQMAFGHGNAINENAEFIRYNNTKRFSIFNGGGDIFFSTNYVSDYRYDLFIESDNGNVGIGTASPLALLNVMGTVRINSASAPDANYYLQLENSSSQKAKANAWDTYSDSRIKSNRQPIINAIDKINLLNPTYYNQHDSYVENDLLNIDYNNSYKSLGFIAQEVYEVIPEAVNMGTTNELWAMDYTKLIPILTKAIQEQQALIKALEQRIINLENK